MLPLADGDDAFGAEFAHASSAWRDLAPTVCYLSEQHRQSDQPFLEVLAAIRANACVGIHRERLAARQIDKDDCPRTARGCSRTMPPWTTINQQRLAKLGGETHSLQHGRQGARALRAGAEARLPVAGDARS